MACKVVRVHCDVQSQLAMDAISGSDRASVGGRLPDDGLAAALDVRVLGHLQQDQCSRDGVTA